MSFSGGEQTAFEEVQTEAPDDTILADIPQIKATLRDDPEFFINFFIADQLSFDVPDIHKVSFKFLVNTTVSRIALALPRNLAKTTLSKLAVVWHWMFTDFRYIVYLSNSQQIAKDACRDIIGYMQSPNFQAVWGTIQFEKESAGEGLYIFQFNGKRCILKALGANQQVRGLNIDNERPQLAVVDDLEDEETAGTPYMLQKLKRWFYSAFYKAMQRKGNKIIWLGTMINNTCMLHEHCKSEFWHSLLFGILLSDGSSLWPDMFPLEQIRRDFKEYADTGQLAAWFAEMMNQPLPGSNALIQAEDLKFHTLQTRAQYDACFVTIDPAAGSNNKSVSNAGLNNTAIVVHGLKDGIPHIAEYWTGKCDEMEMLRHAVRLAYKWQAPAIGIESVLFSKVLITFFEFVCRTEGIEGIEFVPLQAANHKTARLMVWASMIKAGTYLLPEGDFLLINQLLHYDPTKRDNDDDLIDACAHGPQMLERYMGLIISFIGNDLQTAATRSHKYAL